VNESPELSMPLLSPDYVWAISRAQSDCPDPQERAVRVSLMVTAGDGALDEVDSMLLGFDVVEMPPMWEVARTIEDVGQLLLRRHPLAVFDPTLDPFIGVYASDAFSRTHTK